MRILLLAVLLLTGYHSVIAQRSKWQITGQVLDADGEPLPGATLQAADGQAISDTKGRFVFQLNARPQWLSARCIGFFPQRILLDTVPFTNGAARLTIVLKSNTVSLPEIAITTKPMVHIFEEDFQSDLLDYAFAGPDLLLLVAEKKRFYLRLTTDNGKAITQLRLPDRPLFLHESCTGNLHVVSDEWAWEISLSRNDRLDTFPRYPARTFHHLIEPCVLEHQGNYYYQQMGGYRQSVLYFYYDSDGRQHRLIRVRDEVAEDQLLRRHREILYAYMQTIPDVDRDDILNGQSDLSDPSLVLKPENLIRMAETNALVAAIGYFDVLTSDSVYAPLIKTDTGIYLLDHVNDRLLEYPDGVPPYRETHISYHREKGWRKAVLIDAALGRVYGRFSGMDGSLLLKEIDLETGNIRKTYQPRIAPYLSDHYKVRNGILYCIGQPDVNIPNRRLYKLNLFTFAR